MQTQTPSKVTASHLARDAYLYVRQSTVRQVFENTESTQRQYALQERAVALGWPVERVHVIDSDLGRSGALAADRKGFRKLVAEVGIGHAGIVLGLEVSRLARNCADWHRLLELCALSETLILDEDGLYNPNDFNDRLLLGLKGTMSEAELHLLRARLRGGILNKARRGELPVRLPVGLVYDEQGRVRLDPDAQVRESLLFLFEAYRRAGSAFGVVKMFARHKLLFPRRLHGGPRKGELLWSHLTYARVLRVLHNPRYAGAFVFGRTRQRKRPDGGCTHTKLPREHWHTLIPNAHEGYIPWTEYEDNQRRLRESAHAQGLDRRKSPPREGPALLQGLVVCGVCGKRMTVRYHVRRGRRSPTYLCAGDGMQHALPACQQVPGACIDEAMGTLVLDTLTPMALEAALEVQQELLTQLEEADRLRAKQVERARYEADLAQQRYLSVDPRNRLVADALEADWNGALRALQQAQNDFDRQRQADRVGVDPEARAHILALATDFPKLWRAPATSDRDRKRLVRLLLEDVTLIKKETIIVHVRFKGGATTTLDVPRPLGGFQEWKTPPEIVAEIDRLLDSHTVGQIASLLNARGLRSGKGRPFNRSLLGQLCMRYRLKSRYTRLREAGMLTIGETAQRLGVSKGTVNRWRAHGLLRAHLFNDANAYLFEPPGPDAPVKCQGRRLSDRPRPRQL
ncbi:MAG: recombinase family protein, partial [Candidatus Brocadiae bacterium]|nr:recombinase family protein [Candidatus Brocadiia bacterium]